MLPTLCKRLLTLSHPKSSYQIFTLPISTARFISQLMLQPEEKVRQNLTPPPLVRM
jgi:hypothetical protein